MVVATTHAVGGGSDDGMGFSLLEDAPGTDCDVGKTKGGAASGAAAGPFEYSRYLANNHISIGVTPSSERRQRLAWEPFAPPAWRQPRELSSFPRGSATTRTAANASQAMLTTTIDANGRRRCIVTPPPKAPPKPLPRPPFAAVVAFVAHFYDTTASPSDIHALQLPKPPDEADAAAFAVVHAVRTIEMVERDIREEIAGAAWRALRAFLSAATRAFATHRLETGEMRFRACIVSDARAQWKSLYRLGREDAASASVRGALVTLNHHHRHQHDSSHERYELSPSSRRTPRENAAQTSPRLPRRTEAVAAIERNWSQFVQGVVHPLRSRSAGSGSRSASRGRGSPQPKRRSQRTAVAAARATPARRVGDENTPTVPSQSRKPRVPVFRHGAAAAGESPSNAAATAAITNTPRKPPVPNNVSLLSSGVKRPPSPAFSLYHPRVHRGGFSGAACF